MPRFDGKWGARLEYLPEVERRMSRCDFLIWSFLAEKCRKVQRNWLWIDKREIVREHKIDERHIERRLVHLVRLGVVTNEGRRRKGDVIGKGKYRFVLPHNCTVHRVWWEPEDVERNQNKGADALEKDGATVSYNPGLTTGLTTGLTDGLTTGLTTGRSTGLTPGLSPPNDPVKLISTLVPWSNGYSADRDPSGDRLAVPAEVEMGGNPHTPRLDQLEPIGNELSHEPSLYSAPMDGGPREGRVQDTSHDPNQETEPVNIRAVESRPWDEVDDFTLDERYLTEWGKIPKPAPHVYARRLLEQYRARGISDDRAYVEMHEAIRGAKLSPHNQEPERHAPAFLFRSIERCQSIGEHAREADRAELAAKLAEAERQSRKSGGAGPQVAPDDSKTARCGSVAAPKNDFREGSEGPSQPKERRARKTEPKRLIEAGQTDHFRRLFADDPKVRDFYTELVTGPDPSVVPELTELWNEARQHPTEFGTVERFVSRVRELAETRP